MEVYNGLFDIFVSWHYNRWKFFAWTYTKPGEKWLKDL